MLKLFVAMALLIGFLTHATAQDTDGITLTLGGSGLSLGGTLSGDATVVDGISTVTGGTLTLDSNTYSGTATVTGGTVTLGSETGTGATVVTAGNLTLAEGTGSGTLTVTGGNTYTGGATITGGSLTLGNGTTLGAGTLTLGTGSYTGATLNISGTSTIATGGGAALTVSGTLVVNDLGEGAAGIDLASSITFGSEASVKMYFDSLNSTSSLIDVAGDVTLEDTALTVTDSATTPVPVADGTTFTLVHYTGTETGEFEINDVAIPDGGTFTLGDNTFEINYDSGDPNITMTVVPEPSAGMMLVGGVCFLAFWRRATRTKS